VRTGILASRGEYVLFADSGQTVPFRNALAGLRLIRDEGAHLAHGSRDLPGSTIRRQRDWDRKIISRLYHSLALRWLHIPRSLTDTQCGFKIYRGDIARELYSASTLDGFMFDVEIILLALRRGLCIEEFPVEWTCDRDSRLTVRGSAKEILRDLLYLRRRAAVPHPAGLPGTRHPASPRQEPRGGPHSG
jgi:dolichyl-phosphate beta-glucosyltransferase